MKKKKKKKKKKKNSFISLLNHTQIDGLSSRTDMEESILLCHYRLMIRRKGKNDTQLKTTDVARNDR